ncbi:MAG: MarR family transcriptional regulator [Natronomonas sp.]
MQSNSNTKSANGLKVTLDIPLQDANLFRGQAVHDILLFLCRYPTEAFSISELTDTVDYTQPTVSKAIDVLAANGLVTERRDGNRRTVRIDRDRLFRPDDPFLGIPQSEFQTPVRTAVEDLVADLDDVIGIVLYGSVALGTADRRSDIDLWVLVGEDRLSNQRTANRLRQELEDTEFDGDRYAFDIDVEALPAVPNYIEELREILKNGIVVHSTDKFDTVQSMILGGDLDE